MDVIMLFWIVFMGSEESVFKDLGTYCLLNNMGSSICLAACPLLSWVVFSLIPLFHIWALFISLKEKDISLSSVFYIYSWVSFATLPITFVFCITLQQDVGYSKHGDEKEAESAKSGDLTSIHPLTCYLSVYHLFLLALPMEKSSKLLGPPLICL